MKANEMEKILFYYGHFFLVDEMIFHYHNVTLKKDIGKYKAGDKLVSICIDYKSATLDIYDENDNVLDSFKLKLQVCDD